MYVYVSFCGVTFSPTHNSHLVHVFSVVASVDSLYFPAMQSVQTAEAASLLYFPVTQLLFFMVRKTRTVLC